MATRTCHRAITIDAGKSEMEGSWVRMLPDFFVPFSHLGFSPSPFLFSRSLIPPCLQRYCLHGITLPVLWVLLFLPFFFTTCCESLGPPHSSLGLSDPLPPVPTPAYLSEPPTDFTSPLVGLQFTEGWGRASPPSGLGRGGCFLRGVPQPSQKGQTAFWLPSVESQSEGPVLLWVSKSHLWAKRIIKTFSQTFEAAFQTACCQFPS